MRTASAGGQSGAVLPAACAACWLSGPPASVLHLAVQQRRLNENPASHPAMLRRTLRARGCRRLTSTPLWSASRQATRAWALGALRLGRQVTPRLFAHKLHGQRLGSGPRTAAASSLVDPLLCGDVCAGAAMQPAPANSAHQFPLVPHPSTPIRSAPGCLAEPARLPADVRWPGPQNAHCPAFDAWHLPPMQEAHSKDGRPLVDGYAPFCKHIFVPNFTGAPVGALPITDANRHLLQSGGPPARGCVLHPSNCHQGWGCACCARPPASVAVGRPGCGSSSAPAAATIRAVARVGAGSPLPSPWSPVHFLLNAGYTRRRPEELAVLTR